MMSKHFRSNTTNGVNIKELKIYFLNIKDQNATSYKYKGPNKYFSILYINLLVKLINLDKKIKIETY